MPRRKRGGDLASSAAKRRKQKEYRRNETEEEHEVRLQNQRTRMSTLRSRKSGERKGTHVAGPIKEEPVDQQNSDCLTEAQTEEKTEYRIVVKEEGVSALPGVSATADLYKAHTIKDEIVIGPELLHCSTVTPVFYVAGPIKEEPVDQQNSDCLTEAQTEEKTEYRIVVKEEGVSALPGVSVTADLYKAHTIKDEIVIGPHGEKSLVSFNRIL